MKKFLKIILGIMSLLVLIVAIMFIFKITPPPGPWPMPPWAENQNSNQLTADLNNDSQVLLVRIDQESIPLLSKDRLNSLYSHGLGWQGLAIENSIFQMGSKQLISTANQENLPVIAGMNIISLIRVIPIGMPETAAVDLLGNPISFADIPNLNSETADYWRNLQDPVYQEMLLNDAKTNIDMGVNGIVFDDPGTGMVATLIYTVGGSFDDYTMSGFSEFLKLKYPEDQLRNKFNIQDIEAFHFGDYIIANNLQDKWNVRNPNPLPLTYEFELFLSDSNRTILKGMFNKIREYAKSEYDRDLILSFNASPLFPGNFTAPGYGMVDSLFGEHFWFTSYHLKASVAAKLAEGLTPGKFIMLLEVKHDQGELVNPGKNLFKYAFMDTFSSGTASLQLYYPGYWTMRDWGYVDAIDYDDSVFQSYSGFLKNNPSLFSLEEPAKIAVVHSMISRRLNYMPISPSLHNYGAPESQLSATIDMLLNLNVPFDMLVSGDDSSVKSVLDLEQLSAYDLVVLPNVLVMRPEEVDALIEYAQNGGAVLQLNDFANLDVNGSSMANPSLLGLSNQQGVHTVGNGLWITEKWSGDLVGDYMMDGPNRYLLPNEKSSDNQYLQKLGTLVDKYSPSDITVDAPITVNVRRFVDGNRVVIHCTNYNYNQTTDSFTPTDPITVTLSKEYSYLTTAKLYDLETGEIKDVAIEHFDDGIRFTIPSLYSYTIVDLN